MHASPLLKTLLAVALSLCVAACGGGGSDVNISTPTSAPTPGPAASSPSAGAIDPLKWYQVINTNSNKCVDGADASTANGTAIQQWGCSLPVAANQMWQLRPTDSGYCQVVSRYAPSSGWDVEGGVGAVGDGALVHLWSYGAGINQQWQAVALGADSYRFVARHSGKCLDVRDMSASDGARLQQRACTGEPAQSFRLAQQL